MNHIIYNNLAEDYHHKRKKPWKSLEEFLKPISNKKYQNGGYAIDLGCGNGRNFKLLNSKNIMLIGIDNSIQFLKIAKEQLNNVNLFSISEKNSIGLLLSDILFLPIRPNVINNVYSIATIHHIKDKKQRKKLLYQISQTLKDDGYFLFSVWRKYQKKYRWYFIVDWIRRFISRSYHNKQKKLGLANSGDKFVPWKVTKENRTYLRFYHFFSKKEVKKLLKNYKVEVITKLGGPNKKDNFFILAKRR